MVSHHPHGETVEHIAYTEGERDAHGNIRPGWADPIEVGHVAVAPTSSDEDTSQGEQVITGLTLYIPTTLDVSYQDRFRVRGDLFEVTGEPFSYTNPFTGWEPGMTVTVRRPQG